MRLSLGASRGQLVRQLLAESLVLSFVGGALGVVRWRWRSPAGCWRSCPRTGTPLLVQPTPDLRILAFTLGADAHHRHRLRPAAGAAGQPARPVDHAQGHGRRDRRHWRVAVPAQGPGRRAGGAQLPAALRRRALRAEPAEPARAPTRAWRSTTWSRSSCRRRSAATTTQRGVTFYEQLLDRLRSAPGVKSAGLAAVADPRRRRMGQHHVGRGPPAADGEDMQAFMNSAVARLLRDDGDSAARGARLHAPRRETEDRPSPIVNRKFAEHFFPGESAIGPPHRLGRRARIQAHHRDRRRGRRLALRGTARGRAPPGVRPQLGQRRRGVLRAHRPARRPAPTA